MNSILEVHTVLQAVRKLPFILLCLSLPCLLPAQSMTWTTRFASDDVVLNDVVWTGSKFIAVGAFKTTADDGGFDGGPSREYFSTVVCTSADGITWTESHSGDEGELMNVVWTGSMAVAFSNDGRSFSSTDGTTWQQLSYTGMEYPQYLVSKGSEYFAIASRNNSDFYRSFSTLFRSSNLASWTQLSLPDDFEPQAISVIGNVVVAVGSKVLFKPSPDGSYVTGLYDKGWIFRSSDNGITWTSVLISGIKSLNGVVNTGAQLVASDSKGGSWFSGDGIAWTKKTSPGGYGIQWASPSLAQISHSGSGSGHQHWLSLSADGASWTRQSLPVPAALGYLPFAQKVVGNGRRLVCLSSEEFYYAQSKVGSSLHSAEVPPPAIPVTKSPGNLSPPSAVINSLTPSLSWTAVKNAGAYDLRIIEKMTGTTAFQQFGIPSTETSLQVPEGQLAPGQTYEWSCSARLGAVSSPLSAARTFTVSQSVPLPLEATPKSPGRSAPPGSVCSSLTPLLTWLPAENARGYALYIDDLVSSTRIYQNESLGAVASFEVPPAVLEAGKAYRWTLRTRSSSGWSAGSKSLHFMTPAASALPAPPQLLSPGKSTPFGTLVSTLTPQMKWKPAAGATGHGLYVSDADTRALVYDNDAIGSADKLDLPAGILAPGRRYRWNMRTRLGSVWSDYSPRQYFQTAPDYLAPVVSPLPQSPLIGSSKPQSFQVIGLRFFKGAVAYVSNGSVEVATPTVFVNSDLLLASHVTGTTAVTLQVRVRNPDGKFSNSVNLQIASPVAGTLEPPMINPSSGTYGAPVQATISHADSSAVLRYTLDGREPDSTSPLFTPSQPLLLGGKNVTLKARAFKPGIAGATNSRFYNFNLPALKTADSRTGLSGTSLYFKLTLPAGATLLTISSSGGTGDCDLFLASGRIPTPTDYDRKADASPTSQESLSKIHPPAGDWFLLVQGRSSFSNVSLDVVTRLGKTDTTPPVFTPGHGTHVGPLSAVTLACPAPDQQADIYYTTNPQAPDPTPDNASLYTTPLTISVNTTVRARAYAPDKKPSAVVSKSYMILEQGAQEMVFSGDDPLKRGGELEFYIDSASNENSEHYFYFDIPPDGGAGSATAAFPVALTYEAEGVLNQFDVYIKQAPGNASVLPPTASLHDYKLSKLDQQDFIDQVYLNLGRATKLGGAKAANKNILQAGARYYGLLVAKGGMPYYESFYGVPVTTSYVIKLKMTLLSGRLATSDGTPIRKGLDDTWISVHGRADTTLQPAAGESEGNMRPLGRALAQAPGSKVGQVLLLDWSRMADASGLSLSEAAFTPAVGYRASEVLAGAGIPGSKTCVVGHSWGTFVAFEMGKTSKLKRLIALDPATAGHGGYDDSQVKFSTVAGKSWSFVAAYGAFGHEGKAGTAHESFVLYDDDYPNTIPLPLPSTTAFVMQLGVYGNVWYNEYLALHTAPVLLFTHFLKQNHGGGFTDNISPYFSLEQMDGMFLPDRERGAAPWKNNGIGGWSPVPNVFEAKITAEIDVSTGIDTGSGMVLEFKDRSSGTGIRVDQ